MILNHSHQTVLQLVDIGLQLSLLIVDLQHLLLQSLFLRLCTLILPLHVLDKHLAHVRVVEVSGFTQLVILNEH